MELDLCENQFLYGDKNWYDEESDEEIIVNNNNNFRKRYTVRSRPDLFNEYDNIEFVRRFRFRKCTVQMILTLMKRFYSIFYGWISSCVLTCSEDDQKLSVFPVITDSNSF